MGYVKVEESELIQYKINGTFLSDILTLFPPLGISVFLVVPLLGGPFLPIESFINICMRLVILDSLFMHEIIFPLFRLFRFLNSMQDPRV